MRQSGWVVFLVILACMPLFWPPEACSANDAEVLAPGVDFPEGTLFLGDTLYFVDYAGSSVLKLASAGQELVWHETGCGPAGLLARPEGLLVACYDGNHVVLISLDGKVLKRIDQDVDGRGFAGPNDLAADAKGGVYFSASGSNKSGKVYYYGSDGRAKPVASDIDYANGLVLSPDGSRLYVAESEAHRLLYALVAADGSVGPLHEFVNLDALLAKGRSYVPDGVRVDAQGRLFVGLWDGGGFAVIGADGKLIAQVDVAGEHHANLAISPDGRFIFGTTVSGEGSERHGALYKVPNPVFK
jgi:gluconolactonase